MINGDAIELSCPTTAFDGIVQALHRVRSTSETVRVRVEDLEKLIIDHGRLLRAVPHNEPSA